MYKSTNNGTTWNVISSDYNSADGNSATDMDVDNNGNLYILNDMQIWRSADNGISWTEQSSDFNGADANSGTAMTIDINDFIYVVDNSDDIYRSTDEGVSWSLLVAGVGGNGIKSIVAYDQPTAKFQVRNTRE